MASAKERLRQDSEAVLGYCNNIGGKDENVVRLAARMPEEAGEEDAIVVECWHGEKARIEYKLIFSPDYPDNTLVSILNSSDVSYHSKPLPLLFAELVTEWCHANNFTVPELPVGFTSAFSFYAQQLSESSSAMTDEDDDISSDYCESLESHEDGMNSLLQDDVLRLKRLCGENSIESRIHGGINEIDLLLCIDMGFLDAHTASAWAVDTEQPMVMLFHLRSASDYLDGPEPTVKVFQGELANKDSSFGLGGQIEKIMQTFVSSQWKMLSNDKLAAHLEKVKSSLPQTCMILEGLKDDNQESDQCQIHPCNTTPKNRSPHLSKAMGDLTPTASQADLGEPNFTDRTPTADWCRPLTPQFSSQLGTSSFATPTTPKVVAPQFARQSSMGAVLSLESVDNSTKVKEIPSLDNGFLAQCMKYAMNRIPLLNEFCVICDETHVLQMNLIKPCVCSRELCMFAFQTLGVMAKCADTVATDANVVDLLIAMCNAAACSSRAKIILDPYPSIVDPNNTQRMAMDPSNKNYVLVKQALNAIIRGREGLLRGRIKPNSLKLTLDQYHKLAFPLMQWIVATNRSYIVMLPEDRKLKCMSTKYQFLLISSPPAKEAIFQKAKDRYGSVYAFHGSNIENWHSIMRAGLLNASGTQYQLHGAAYGNGIYLSPNSDVSFGYCSTSYEKQNLLQHQTTLSGKLALQCIALCEVVTESLKKNGNIWVCSNPDHVVTRFFFVYDAQRPYSTNGVNTQTPGVRAEILYAVGAASVFKRPNY